MKRETLTRVGAASALLIGLVGVAPPASAAAVGCHGSGCSGALPEVQGCDADARTPSLMAFEHPSAPGSAIQLRVSARCDAAWVRVKGSELTGGGMCVHPLIGRIQRRVYLPTQGGWQIDEDRQISLGFQAACHGGTEWSRMVNAAPAAQLRVGTNVSGFGWTSWYDA